ncbi:cysteine hydrolase family protein [Sulfuriferula nivalis]|uniref:Cysteine hydrolase n=1 Tax=Sulfuriferula nivalis TaxID=2675298 RepID=A0A809RHD6_9PROT|nr:cysteine hydrolase [Sulfuriferula nivalis]BBP00965.1 cysteine hydrolase [Sulfuriferula nivalis]
MSKSTSNNYAVTAEPYVFNFSPEHTAVIMIDMQRDFILPGGFGASLGNDVDRLAATVPVARQLLDWCRAHGMLVVHTKEAHKGDLSDCPLSKLNRGNPTVRIGDQSPMGRILIDGEEGSDFVAELTPLPNEVVIVKPGKGAFYATELGSLLQQANITHLLFGGVTTEVCVQTTMREANDRGYECLLVEDATESYFPEFKQSTIDMIRAQGGIVGWTAPLSAILSATKVASDDQ